MPLFIDVSSKIFIQIIFTEIQIITLTAKPTPEIFKIILTQIKIVVSTKEIHPKIKTLIYMFYLLITKTNKTKSTKQVGSLIAWFLSSQPEPFACIHVDVNLPLCHEKPVNRIAQLDLGGVYLGDELLDVAVVIESLVVL